MSALFPTIIPISEAKPRLSSLVTASQTEDVVLTRHGRAAAVLVSADRYSHLLDQLEDAQDSLEALTAKDDGEPIPAEQVYAELGLTLP